MSKVLSESKINAVVALFQRQTWAHRSPKERKQILLEFLDHF